jgi:hypothetical protein
MHIQCGFRGYFHKWITLPDAPDAGFLPQKFRANRGSGSKTAK